MLKALAGSFSSLLGALFSMSVSGYNFRPAAHWRWHLVMIPLAIVFPAAMASEPAVQPCVRKARTAVRHAHGRR